MESGYINGERVNWINPIQRILLEQLTWTRHHARLGGESLVYSWSGQESSRSLLTFVSLPYPALFFLPYCRLFLTYYTLNFLWICCDWKTTVITTTTTKEIITKFFLFGRVTWHKGILVSQQGLNPCLLCWKHRVLTTVLPGKSHWYFLNAYFVSATVLNMLTHSLSQQAIKIRATQH